MAKRTAPAGRLDVAAVALGQLHFGPDDVLVAGLTASSRGRSIFTISKLPALNVLDPRGLDDSQLEQCRESCESFRTRSLLPANEAYRDPVRKELDAALWTVLGLPAPLLTNLNLLRNQWCTEPSVHGGKRTRPDGPGVTVSSHCRTKGVSSHSTHPSPLDTRSCGPSTSTHRLTRSAAHNGLPAGRMAVVAASDAKTGGLHGHTLLEIRTGPAQRGRYATCSVARCDTGSPRPNRQRTAVSDSPGLCRGATGISRVM